MLNATQLRELIIRPVLRDLVMYSEEYEELIVFTCAVESLGGSYLKQINGPALGIYQMEPETYNDIWQNYINNKPKLSLILLSNFACSFMPSEERLIYDLRFATAMCRIQYYRSSELLPAKYQLDDIWNYYKNHYNTQKGAAMRDESIQKYQEFIKA